MTARPDAKPQHARTTANAGDEQDNVCQTCGDHKPCGCDFDTCPTCGGTGRWKEPPVDHEEVERQSAMIDAREAAIYDTGFCDGYSKGREARDE